MVKQGHLPFLLLFFHSNFITYNHSKKPNYSILAFIFTINTNIAKTHKNKILHII